MSRPFGIFRHRVSVAHATAARITVETSNAVGRRLFRNPTFEVYRSLRQAIIYGGMTSGDRS